MAICTAMPQVGLRLRALHSQYSPTWHSKMPHQQQIATNRRVSRDQPSQKSRNPEFRLVPLLAIRLIAPKQAKKVGGVGFQSKLREFSSPSPSPASQAVIRPWVPPVIQIPRFRLRGGSWPGLRDPLQWGPVCLKVLAPWPRNGEPTMESRPAIHRSPIHDGWRGISTLSTSIFHGPHTARWSTWSRP